MRLLDLVVGDEIEISGKFLGSSDNESMRKRYRVVMVPYGSSLSSPRVGGFQDEEVSLRLKEVETVLSDVRTVDGKVGSRAKDLEEEEVQRLLREGYTVQTLNDPAGPFTGRKLGDGGPRP
jgi:hypothetical protein